MAAPSRVWRRFFLQHEGAVTAAQFTIRVPQKDRGALRSLTRLDDIVLWEKADRCVLVASAARAH
jgi:hypothetical protein